MGRGPRVMILDPDARQAPFLEYDKRTKRWRVWLAFDKEVDNGTYLDLFSTGLAERITQQDAETNVVILTGPVT